MHFLRFPLICTYCYNSASLNVCQIRTTSFIYYSDIAIRNPEVIVELPEMGARHNYAHPIVNV